MNPALVAALAAGATVVTPNKRLARHLVERHDRARVASGARAWPAARVLPWTAWVAALEDEAVDRGLLPPRPRLAPGAVALAWRSAIEADATPPQDVDGLARLAVQGWDLVYAWGEGGDSWRAWTGHDGEAGAFARWALAYRKAIDAANAGDLATVPERLAPVAAAWRGQSIVLAGFLALTPQQRRLAQVLRDAGAEVVELQAVGDDATSPVAATFDSDRDEWRAAFAWARARAERDPGARVGIVVPDLAQRLDAVRACAIDVLGHPAAGADPSWNLSLGAALGDVPRIAAALDLVALVWTALPAGRAAALLRSEALPGADAMRALRARAERRWLEEGMSQVTLDDAMSALDGRDADLARRFDALRTSAKRLRRGTRRQWVDGWRAAWSVAGWPGDRPAASDDWQAARAFDEALAAYAALDQLPLRGKGALAPEAALREFGSALADTTFQPERAPAPIQVLGLYEALGLPFDALWATGMDDATLPAAPRPHALLPIPWQRERGVPRSDAAGELAHAQAIVGALLRAAPSVVVSHAHAVDDQPRARSPLFRDAPSLAATPPVPRARVLFDAKPAPERIDDGVAPPAEGAPARGGTALLQAQSDCPFQALAAMRWRAEPWPEPVAGLTALERGNLAHAALASFWDATRDHASLVKLVADRPRYDQVRARAVAEAMRLKVDRARWERLPPILPALERERLEKLVEDWIACVDLVRPPFEVEAVEREARLAPGGLPLRFRIDRIDRLADGGRAVLDYKTGRVPSIGQWRGERPRALQIALYALALRAEAPDERVRAAVLACTKRGEVRPVGLYADDDARFPPLPKSSGRGAPIVVDWSLLEAEWGATSAALAQAFLRGDAAVAPNGREPCVHCGRQALCRVGTGDDDDDGDHDAGTE